MSKWLRSHLQTQTLEKLGVIQPYPRQYGFSEWLIQYIMKGTNDVPRTMEQRLAILRATQTICGKTVYNLKGKNLGIVEYISGRPLPVFAGDRQPNKLNCPLLAWVRTLTCRDFKGIGLDQIIVEGSDKPFWPLNSP
jgi:hypothetical protein